MIPHITANYITDIGFEITTNYSASNICSDCDKSCSSNM